MSESPAQEKDLGFIFVQLLFALAIGEVARRFAPLLDLERIAENLSGICHLLLALLVVSTSWVGWANSPMNRDWRIDRTFSHRFGVLLLDVFLVILYFLLAYGAEGPVGGRAAPSAREETWAVFWIFVGYVVWDALTKRGRPGRVWRRRGLITGVCTLLALLVWALHRDVTHPRGVIIADLILILIVLTFRAFKDKPSNIASRALLIVTVGFILVTWCFPSIMGGLG